MKGKCMNRTVKVESEIKFTIPLPTVFCPLWRCYLVLHVQHTSDCLVSTHAHNKLAARSERRRKRKFLHSCTHHMQLQWYTVSRGSFPNISISALYICSAVPSKNLPQVAVNSVSPTKKIHRCIQSCSLTPPIRV